MAARKKEKQVQVLARVCAPNRSFSLGQFVFPLQTM